MGKEFEICRDIESFCSFVKVCHRFDSVENTTHYSLFLEAFKNASDYKWNFHLFVLSLFALLCYFVVKMQYSDKNMF